MPIRITGMNSGLDTESIISELMKAKKTNVDKVKKQQTTLQWKQDAWKDLNSKVHKLFNTTLNGMRFEADYSKKKTDVSNSAVASVVSSDSAMNTTQKMKIEDVAAAGYLTGAKLSGSYTANTKIKDMAGVVSGSSFSVEVGGESKEITITDDTTIEGLVSALQDARVNANFDEKNQRFYSGAKTSGTSGDFIITESGSNGNGILSHLGLDDATNPDAKRIPGKNAAITLNGIRYESTSNVFEVNGLTITALGKKDDEVTLTTRQDTDGIYNKITSFIKEYNSLINEMDKLYNAERPKGYEPLTEEEKKEMSESEIEKWETKIKDSILKRDSNLATVASNLKTIMLAGVDVNGTRMNLSDFGIETLGYFSAPENEKNAYHIDGDENDSSTSSREDKLRAAIVANPNTVISFFAGLSQNLYNNLDKMTARTELRSFGSIYDDKKMKEEYDNYTKRISALEKKLTAMEDRYYKQFSVMETALAKLQSNQSAISGLIGGM